MKTRNGFVSNSSSTSFIIKNKSDKEKDLVDFVKENPQLIEDFKNYYDWFKKDPKCTQTNLIKSAKQLNIIFKPQERKTCIFGDVDGTLIGLVFDYILRDGGESENFKWKFKESLR